VQASPRVPSRVAAAIVPVLALALGACAGGAPARPDDSRAPDDGLSAADEGAGAVSADGRGPRLPPSEDADRDRVPDVGDDCPDSPPGEIVDEVGCALFVRVLDGVVFPPGDHRLGADARIALGALVTDLETHPDVIVRLEGHTDNRGTAAANLELSKLRVMSVARFLVAAGVAPERLRPYGLGESRPRAGNSTETGRERNRRIEIGLASE